MGARGKLADALQHIGGAIGLEALEHLEHRKNARPAATWDRFLTESSAERQNGHAVEVNQADVAQCGRNSLRLVELPLARHRSAGIEEEVDRKVLLFVEQAQQQPVET